MIVLFATPEVFAPPALAAANPENPASPTTLVIVTNTGSLSSTAAFHVTRTLKSKVPPSVPVLAHSPRGN